MSARPCPDKEKLFGYVTGTIPPEEAEEVAVHVDSCGACEQTVAALEGLSDTMISALRRPAPVDAFAEEPQCAEVREQLRYQMERPTTSADVPQPPPSATPSRRQHELGDYVLLKKLGQGGMGTVYQARHTHLKRIVALKVLPKECLGNEQAVARFQREMEAVGRLDHPHIVRAMDAREVDGIRFLVMEYLDGLDLSEVVQRSGALRIPDACESIRQAAVGLQCAQEHGLVHRDIKPSNLMLTTEGQVKVLDLGLAQIQETASLDGNLTGVGQIMGTPDYISPEQALESHTVDIRTDIYSLGCSLYYLLSGYPPFHGPQYDTPLKKVTGHIRDTIRPIEQLRTEIPRPIRVLLQRMLMKDPEQRVAGPSEVIDALAPFCQGSKLIGLLREAQRQANPDKEKDSYLETNELQASSVDTSSDGLDSGLPPEEQAAIAGFDPYHRWLGIPPAEQPPHHYRLLGLGMFESDAEVIRDAATRQMAHVRSYHLGQHARVVATATKRAWGGQGLFA